MDPNDQSTLLSGAFLVMPFVGSVVSHVPVIWNFVDRKGDLSLWFCFLGLQRGSREIGAHSVKAGDYTACSSDLEDGSCLHPMLLEYSSRLQQVADFHDHPSLDDPRTLNINDRKRSDFPNLDSQTSKGFGVWGLGFGVWGLGRSE